MANPSDTGPSGVGTEVLRRAYKSGMVDSQVVLIDGVANHIYTVLCVSFTNIAADTQALTMLVEIDGSGGANEIQLLRNYPLGPKEMFVYNEKIVLTDTDELIVNSSSSGSDIDVYCSFIDQEFTT